MQVDTAPRDFSPHISHRAPSIQRPTSAVPIRPFAQPPVETAVGIASTVPYVPVSSHAVKKEFGYVQKRLRKTSMDVGAMVQHVISKLTLGTKASGRVFATCSSGDEHRHPQRSGTRTLSTRIIRSTQPNSSIWAGPTCNGSS